MVETRCASPTTASAVERERRRPISSWISSSTTGPVRSFGPGRSTSTPTDAAERGRGRRAPARRVRAWTSARAVRGVEPHDVDAGGEQRAHRFRVRRARADGRHDLRAPHHHPDYQRRRSVEPWIASSSPGCARWACTACCPRSRCGRSRSRSTSSSLVDLAPAGASDDLADTVDYGAVCEAVSRVVASEHYRLLERLATRIAEVCRADPRVVRRGGRGAQAAAAGARAARPRRASASSGERARVPRARLEPRRPARASAARGRRAGRAPTASHVVAVSRVYETAPGRRAAAGRVPERGGRGRHRPRPARAARARAARSRRDAQRVRAERWGPRTLDVDVLLVRRPAHRRSRAHRSRTRGCGNAGFVLAPLRDVAPELVDAGRGVGRRARGGGNIDAFHGRNRQRTVALIGPGRAGTTIALGSARAGLDGRRRRRPRARRARRPSPRPRASRRAPALVSDVGARRGARDRRHSRPRDRAGAARGRAVDRAGRARRPPRRLARARRVRAAARAAHRRAGRRAAPAAVVSVDDRSGSSASRGAWAAVAGDPARRRASRARSGCGRSSSPTPTAARYHAAAVVASNHLVALLGQVERLAATLRRAVRGVRAARARVGAERLRARSGRAR